ncbi:hypothetical protein M9458_047518, partial [Cirrhinus mrigala]
MGEQSLLCELDLPPDMAFTDADSYSISLRSSYHGNNFSVVLDAHFMPREHVRPVSPSNLVLFQWQSGYDPENYLISHLQYQLSIYSQHK